MNALAMWTPAFIIGYLLTLAVSITGSVMVGLAVYNDAKSKMSLNAVMWAMLVGILGWIPGIVYLCVRNNRANRLMACPQCGFTHRVAEPFCPQCHVQNPYSAPFQNPLAAQQAHRAKLLLIWGIVAYVAVILLAIISVCWLTASLIGVAMY